MRLTWAFASFSILFSIATNAAETFRANDSFDFDAKNYCGYPIWYDDWYCRFNITLEHIANETNRWFLSPDTSPEDQVLLKGKVRLGWEPRSGSLNEFDTRFRLNVKLPALENRVELLLTDEEDDINQQAVKAARSEELGNQEETTVALQFSQDPKSRMRYRLGFGRGGQLYTRARYSNSKIISKRSTFNYFGDVHYYSGDKLGAELNGKYSFKLNQRQALEFSNSFRYRDVKNEWFWRHELNYLYLIDDEQSLLFTTMVDGLSEPNYRSEQRLTSIRYKRNILRQWLFLEIEPYLIRLRKEGFRASYGVAIRLEIHFSNH